ncbi:MAG: chorismate synthase [Phycisphaerae bacterium]
MATLTYRTAGESHGPALVSIVEGLPAGLELDIEFINGELRRRQGGYGRGGRQRIETDMVNFRTGFRRGKTIGSPLVVEIPNKDSRLDVAPALVKPRPGHADLAGATKWLTTDCRETLERASARETASRVAVGAIARCLLKTFGIEVIGFVVQIGCAKANVPANAPVTHLRHLVEASEVYCPDVLAAAAMVDQIKAAKIEGDTLGGIVETRVIGCPIGLGNCAQWDWKLDSRIAAEVMGIQAIKGVEIGLGFKAAELPGSDVHDPIEYDPALRTTPMLGFTRPSNNAGGLEGGMTNGQPVVVRAAMKPISTLLKKAMPSVDLNNKNAGRADYERSDVCAVPAAAVVVENVIAFEIARAMVEKFGGDSMREMRTNYEQFLAAARQLGS